MEMKILIIGNGFDLAHGLKTRYNDFLNYTSEFYQNNNRENDKIHDILFKDLVDNIWFEYFYSVYNRNQMRGENWIDFETEITDVIEWIDANTGTFQGTAYNMFNRMCHSTGYNVNSSRKINGTKLMMFAQCIIKNKGQGSIQNKSLDYIVNEIYSDLNRLGEALEIYLYLYADKVNVDSRLSAVNDIRPDKVISFNYTHTYQKYYDSSIPVSYIHGECRQNPNDYENDDSNIVLGALEYLQGDDRNTDPEYIEFKKFQQRIEKNTDKTYLNFISSANTIYKRAQSIRSKLPNPEYADTGISDVYFIGHSLDASDADILGKFFNSKSFNIHVYYHNLQDKTKLSKNFIRIIGQDEYNNRMNGIGNGLELLQLG